MGVISFLDVAKAVLEEQSFENKMLKSYIKNSAQRDAGRLTNLSRRLRSPLSHVGRSKRAIAGRVKLTHLSCIESFSCPATLLAPLFTVTSFGESHGPRYWVCG